MRTICNRQAFQMFSVTVFTVLLVLAGAFCVSGEVLGQSSKISKEQKEYYKALEHEYVRKLRAYLEEQGYADSGVTMNRVIEDDGSVEYTVTIHHRRIFQLGAGQREALAFGCRGIGFPVDGCRFCYTFLETSF